MGHRASPVRLKTLTLALGSDARTYFLISQVVLWGMSIAV